MSKKEEAQTREIKLDKFKIGESEVTYKQLILNAVNGQIPKDGMTFGEMKARLALSDKVEAAADDGVLTLLESEFKTISEIIMGTKWTILEKELVKFIELFEKHD